MVHRRHGQEKRARYGKLGRNEIAFVGTKCGAIQELAERLIQRLHTKYPISYVDANHGDEGLSSQDYLRSGSVQSAVQFHDGISINKVHSSEWDQRIDHTQSDLVLINGNHQPGNTQIVFLDKQKTDSLNRRLDQLSDVLFFIDTDGTAVIPDFIPDDFKQKEIINLNEVDRISQKVDEWMTSRRPKLNALILVGGRSSRMGTDKAHIEYNNVPQYQYLKDLLDPLCDEVYLGGRSDQRSQFQNHPFIEDVFIEMGPMGSILSAFKQKPDDAWLVVACDMPLIDQPSIEKLISERSSRHAATAYIASGDEFPQPLFAIYEPKIFPRALSFLSLGYQCPRKLLINSDTYQIHPTMDEVLLNANTPEEGDQIRSRIHEKVG